ncbi:hypothetical protein NX059_008622 [Plenodomus lindquistii]|nr:hypothetical protein NX059_008622 [Plenodomus lindquistii]
MSPRSKPSHQIEFLPRTRQPKRSLSGLSERSTGSISLSSSASDSTSSSTHLRRPSATSHISTLSQGSTGPHRHRDSLAAFKSSDSLASLQTSSRQRNGSPVRRASAPLCITNRPQRDSLAIFKNPKPIVKVREDKACEEEFSPFEYFPPWEYGGE